jgi:hypothetical protein
MRFDVGLHDSRLRVVGQAGKDDFGTGLAVSIFVTVRSELRWKLSLECGNQTWLSLDPSTKLFKVAHRRMTNRLQVKCSTSSMIFGPVMVSLYSWKPTPPTDSVAAETSDHSDHPSGSGGLSKESP